MLEKRTVYKLYSSFLLLSNLNKQGRCNDYNGVKKREGPQLGLCTANGATGYGYIDLMGSFTSPQVPLNIKNIKRKNEKWMRMGQSRRRKKKEEER